MKTLVVLNILVLVIVLLVSSSYEYDGELQEVNEILRELENGEMGRRQDDDDDIDCSGVCNPFDSCECVIPECLPSTCTGTRDIDLSNDDDEALDEPTKRFFLFRFCRRFLIRRRLRICRFKGK